MVAGGTGEYRSPEGEEILASYAVVRGAMLGVMVERPKRDAFLAANRLTKRSSQAAILVIVIAALFSVFLASALTRRLMKLSEAAGRLEKGQFDVLLEAPSNDELGDLARSVNLAAHGLRERDEQLKSPYDQLLQSEKLAGFGKFSAGIAHEIKNPLTGIIGFSQIIARRLPDGDPSKKNIALVEREAKRCKTILDNLLKFTRKEGFNFEPVRVHAFVDDLVELMAPQVNLHHARVDVDLSATDDLIKGDRNQLQQVFMNLAMNALDAMEDSEDKRLWIATADAEPGFVEIRVSDNGTGIPESVLRKVFDPFFTTKEQGKGTGLGLSVSYGIITNHGGRISVRNRDEGGAEFRVLLPAASTEVRGEERRKAEVPANA